MYTELQRQQLLQVARDSIDYGIKHGRALPVVPEDYDVALQQPRATFVTLKIHGELRGCIGRLQAERPLIRDVAENAYSAAFQDPRFPALREAEYPQLEYHISVLTEPENIPVTSEQELIEKLVPGQDGLIIDDGLRRATFLPSVWESLPNPHDFVQQLKRKAGMPAHGWSDQIHTQRYAVEEF